LQTHITWHAHLYVGSDGDPLPFEALRIAMQSIACDTVITANRPGPWPYHERYADKQVTPKARHNSHDEAPYEKNKGSSKLPRQLHDYILDLRGVHHFSRVVFWEFFVVHTLESNQKTWNETADIWQVQYENETTKQLTGNSRII
jgi:hypothetical protein